ncbi:flagellar protein FlgN [Nitrosomonas sp. JL21]|uniref:flagella synthesis protein FlgN n=1 Tax=Nitrosomonas sp. JL21 TaxID=153949 RepID=UPI0013689174|nr:flagellar protein FlgN [Nitrosomonas sp. JL21]MBL8496879.1 flagellar protein FlgN [Nitrosomonas sp.]MBL8498060.1 flagellar protein FlgN [Nitrosomonas sp.]MCC7092068.1 flagellar protein FlgN [Nitrosomonas sp.]MXS77653.1 flagellar protein FlgN [Nitrosomonas sp. JL21]
MIASLLSPNFVTDLGFEKKAFESFIEILKKEEQALMQGKFEEIDHLVTEKTRLIEKLIHLDDQRNKFFHSQGIRLNNVNAWLEDYFVDRPKARTLWNEVVGLARIAQTLNHTNSLMTSTLLQQNQRAFSALHCAAGNIALYGPKGQTYL